MLTVPCKQVSLQQVSMQQAVYARQKYERITFAELEVCPWLGQASGPYCSTVTVRGGCLLGLGMPSCSMACFHPTCHEPVTNNSMKCHAPMQPDADPSIMECSMQHDIGTVFTLLAVLLPGLLHACWTCQWPCASQATHCEAHAAMRCSSMEATHSSTCWNNACQVWTGTLTPRALTLHGSQMGSSTKEGVMGGLTG